jgi:hypothetical protein
MRKRALWHEVGHNEVEALGFMPATHGTDTLLGGAVEEHLKALVAKPPIALIFGGLSHVVRHHEIEALGFMIATRSTDAAASASQMGRFETSGSAEVKRRIL